MKPAWDQLIEAYKGKETALVADVDCTAEGSKDLCEEIGVRGYPTIKYGDPNNLEDYKGGRDFETLKAFADANLGPKCGPSHLELCDEEKKAEVTKMMSMSLEDLEAAVEKKNGQMEKVEADFKELLEGLQKQYSEANEKKNKDVEDVKNSGLGMMKSVLASRKPKAAPAAAEAAAAEAPKSEL